MDDVILQAIADLSAVLKDADSGDTKRIRKIIERLKTSTLISNTRLSALLVCTESSIADSSASDC